MTLKDDALADDAYREVLLRLRNPPDEMSAATKALMELTADMLEEEMVYSAKQSVAALEQREINRDLLGIVNMLKDLLLTHCVRKNNG